MKINRMKTISKSRIKGVIKMIGWSDKTIVRIITGITVISFILAGAPFLNISTNDAHAVSNPYAVSSPNIFNLANSSPTSSDSYILWDTDISGNNRVYYGTNQSDVNSLTNGLWSMWSNNTRNVSIRISGLSANTTYYYKPESISNIANDSVNASSLLSLKSGVWTSPSEYMVSPPGWTGSPVNFRTVNINVAILDDNGSYIPNLSPEAIIYDNTGNEIGRTNLNGIGPYTGSYILPDFLNEGGYSIRITGYPGIGGEFSVLRWGCAGCHTNNYPSTFNAANVHSRHIDTTDISNMGVVHCADDMCETETQYTSTQSCSYCHVLRYPTWAIHPQNYACNSCHISPNSGNAALKCENCHNDRTTIESYTSPRYGLDKHNNLACSECHGTLTSMIIKPNCTTCHPRPGTVMTISDSIENTSHTANHTVACGLCHNREHDIKSLQSIDSNVCRNCHPGITHDAGAQCTTCHGNDPHNFSNPHSSINTEQECRNCHGNNTAVRHHSLAANGTYQCTDCHPMIYDNTTQSYSPQIIRDCLVCHHF